MAGITAYVGFYEICSPKKVELVFISTASGVVGGKILDAVLPNIRPHGRITACGTISQYDEEEPDATHNLMYVIVKKIRMQGFIVFYYFIVEGIEAAPTALVGHFSGRNVGKQFVLVARD
ncbi:hypothetical protein SASPL_141597 [Salvia splendens]|uniref:Uncharacterized protein n=1 Tax=Salvia splendens TaxID=180675 RepID=A0A8X8ZDK9_SALSN|nr:hypothetical protein SASPL_141597 [Salvia splendens]